jgi:hypothetical protein
MDSEEDFNELDYPHWLYRELVEDYLPWEQGRKIFEFETILAIDPREEFSALSWDRSSLQGISSIEN